MNIYTGETKTMREYGRSYGTEKPHANVLWRMTVPDGVTIDSVLAGQIAQGMLASLTHEVIRSAESGRSSASDPPSFTPSCLVLHQEIELLKHTVSELKIKLGAGKPPKDWRDFNLSG
jgi:hypothetical protein